MNPEYLILYFFVILSITISFSIIMYLVFKHTKLELDNLQKQRIEEMKEKFDNFREHHTEMLKDEDDYDKLHGFKEETLN